MIRTRFVTLLVSLMLALPVAAQDDPPKKEDSSITLEVKGQLRTGIAAIGGETTGVLLGTREGFGCEVAGVQDETLDGKTVVIKGSYSVRPGVEIRERRILKADKVAVAKDKPEEHHVKAEILGKVMTGVVAAGGETTGTTISAAGTTWELNLSKDKDLAAAAEKLNGKKARVTGTVTVKKPVTGRQLRTIVLVDSIKAADQ